MVNDCATMSPRENIPRPGLGWQLPWPLWLGDGRGLEEVLFSPWRAFSVVTERWPRMDQGRRRETWRVLFYKIVVVDPIIRRDNCLVIVVEPGQPRKLDWLPWEPFEYWHSDGERLLDPIAGWAHTSHPSSGGSVTYQQLEANPPTEACGNSVEELIRCRC